MIRTTFHCDLCELPFAEGYGQNLIGEFVPCTATTPYGVLKPARQFEIHACCRAHGTEIQGKQAFALAKHKRMTVDRLTDCANCGTRNHSGPCKVSGKSAASGERV